MPGKKARKNAQPSPTRAQAAGTAGTAGTARDQAGFGIGMQLHYTRGKKLVSSSPLVLPRGHEEQVQVARSRVCYSTQEIWRQTELPAETSESDSQTLLLRNLTASKTCIRGLQKRLFLRRCTLHQFEERLHCNWEECEGTFTGALGNGRWNTSK
ncbi:phorbol-12-myristate-13-acetate-induced protein 1 isoform X3 [Macaca fascicularis]|uniref:phorbol-12-myristate-13-acetate-induced protein 1 isoform X3 n=1 Tax=Macaca fascicularis TaxID=9541 RepID=UPI0032B050FF